MKNKLSDIIDHKPKRDLKHIKDYALIDRIFNAYLDQHYEWMAKEIFYYNQFEFFWDFAMYLNEHFKTDTYKKFFYRDIQEMFDERILEILYKKSIRRLAKKYGL